MARVERIYNTMDVADNRVYKDVRLLKSDVSTRKLQTKGVTVNTRPCTPLSALHRDMDKRLKKRAKEDIKTLW